jgi:exopolysaccharide biosynthesis WecB/TagA/CpsF family protein
MTLLQTFIPMLSKFSIKLSSINLLKILKLIHIYDPNWFKSAISKKESKLITFVNPFSVYVANYDSTYIDHLNSFDLIFADGMLMAMLASKFNGVSTPRLSFDGNSIASEVLTETAYYNCRVFIIGGKPGIAKKAGQYFTNETGLKVIGVRNGYFDNKNQIDSLAQKIIAHQPEVVICGMGAGLQENLLLILKNYGWKGIGITCGGYLEQAASVNKMQYYPSYVNKWNIRALYRIYKDPRRLIRRYTLCYLPFYLSSIRVLLFKNHN